MLSLSHGRGQSSGRGASARAALTLEIQEQQSTQKMRPCRIIMAVDVSGSMRWLIDTVVNGISGINAVLDNEDLVSVM